MRKIIFFPIFFLCLTLGCGGGSELFIGPLINLGVQWANGKATKYYPFDSQTIYFTTQRSLRSLNYKIKSTKKLGNGKYDIVAGNNNRFSITVRPVENNTTKLSIRVNIMGDKPYAEMIYKEIDKNLNIIEFDENGNPVSANRP